MIRTKNPSSTIYSEFIPSETFSDEIALFDLNQFLQIHSLFDNPEIDINGQESLRILDKQNAATYYMSDPSNLIVATKGLKSFDIAVSFDLTKETMMALTRAASALKTTHISFESDDVDNILIKTFDPKLIRSSSNTMERIVGKNTTGATFRFVFDMSQMNFVSGSYRVENASQLISKFTNTSGLNLTYWLAQEAQYSSYNE